MVESLVPNSPYQDRYRSILKAVDGLERKGVKDVRTQFIRWVVSEPGSNLWGSKTEEEAIQMMANAIRGQGRASVPGLIRGVMSRVENLPGDLSQRAFVGYLDHLVANGWLTRIERGKYRLNRGEFTMTRLENHPGPLRAIGTGSPYTQRTWSIEGVEEPLAETTTSPVAVGLDENLSEEEERLVTAIGDTLSLLIDALSLIWGPSSKELARIDVDPEDIDPEDLPAELQGQAPEDTDFFIERGVPVGLAAMAKRFTPMRDWKREDSESYEQMLEMVRKQLERSRHEIGKVLWSTKGEALEIVPAPYWGPEHGPGLWKRDAQYRSSYPAWDSIHYIWG